LRAASLDRLLAAGAEPEQSPLLARRAQQLTGERMRGGLAAALESVREEARSPRPGRSAVIRPRGRNLSSVDAQLRQLIERLCDGEEVSPRGVVLVKQLLSDGASPLYIESPDGALADELTVVCQALDGSR
jgi:hypothetical protein